MKPLEPPDSHILSSAIGWLELGNRAEAKSELIQLSDTVREHPDVLETRWLLCADEENWVDGLRVAEALVRIAPQRASGWLHQAYALRRVPDGSLERAFEALLPAVEKFPQEPIIAYNLGCYACQLQQLDEARQWLQRAIRAGTKDTIKSMALADPDYQPLWEEVRQF